MNDEMSKLLRLPKGVPTARHRPDAYVSIPEGLQTEDLPLIDGKTPVEKRVQEVWVAHVRVFDLSDEKQSQDYELVWQRVCDGHARISESQINYDEKKSSYVALLRWADIEYRLPPKQG